MTSTASESFVPATVNLRGYQGDSFTQQFRFLASGTPIDLTVIELRAQARSTTGRVLDLPVSIVGAAVDGTAALHVPDDLGPDVYSYDMQATESGTITTWLRGKLQILRDVTA